jgi:hypothetical protein
VGGGKEESRRGWEQVWILRLGIVKTLVGVCFGLMMRSGVILLEDKTPHYDAPHSTYDSTKKPHCSIAERTSQIVGLYQRRAPEPAFV